MGSLKRFIHKTILVLIILSTIVEINVQPIRSFVDGQSASSEIPLPPIYDSTIGGFGRASLYPYGVGVDAKGYIYIADCFNNLIRKYAPNLTQILSWGGIGWQNGKVRKPQGLAVDRNGYVYVADTGNHRIQKFDANGTFLWAAGKKGIELGNFMDSLGIAVSNDVANTYSGQPVVYVTDRPHHRVQKFDSNGTFILAWGPEPGPGQLNDPRGVAVDNNGDVFVVDMGDMVVKKFDSSGNFLNVTWGGKGITDSKFTKPQGIHIDINGFVYLADSYNHRIQKFTSDGTFVSKWGEFGFSYGQFYVPQFLAIDSYGKIFVADIWNYRVQIFDSDATFLNSIDGSPPPDGTFTGPHDVAVDYQGNVFVVEADNHRVQKFDDWGHFVTKWGNISPTGSAAKIGYWSGTFNYPNHASTDIDGNVYVTDGFNHRVQVFSPNGTYLRMWGGWGTSNARFQTPEGIAVSSQGYVYVADRGHRIQKFYLDGTFVLSWGTHGTGNGQFNMPAGGGVAVDPEGNVYVADSGNNRMQKFDSNGTFITKWGSYGTKEGQFNNPSDVAVDSNMNVCVVDTNNHRVQVFDPDGNFLYVWGSYGKGPMQFIRPTGIDVDLNGFIYVADSGNDRVQKFRQQSTDTYIPAYVSTIGGYGSADMYPYGIDFDEKDNMYVVDEYQHRILKYAPNGTLMLQWGKFGNRPGEFSLPKDVAYHNGRLYVTDKYNHRIQVFDTNGTWLFQWGKKGIWSGQFDQPDSIAIDSNGYVYVTECGNDRVQKFYPNGTFILLWGGKGTANGMFQEPRGIAVDDAGYVYVADANNHRIQKFDSNGTFITKWGKKGDELDPPKFDKPYAVAVDHSGYVYVADTWNHNIKKYDTTGTPITEWGTYGNGTGQFHGPKGIGVDSNGSIYISDQWNYRIQKFTSDGSFISMIGGKGTEEGKFLDPRAISIGPDGTIYVLEAWVHRFQAFDSNGNFIFSVGQPPAKFLVTDGNGTFNYPKGIAVNGTGFVYVADSQNQRIQVFNSDGTYLFKWGAQGSGPGQFKRPEQLAIDIAGNVYVTDVLNDRVQKFDSNGNYLTSWGGSSGKTGSFSAPNGMFNTLRGIAVDKEGFVYVADPWNFRIQKFDSNGNFITKWGGHGTGPGEFLPPGWDSADATGFGLAVDDLGRVYVADTGNHRIQVFDSSGKFLFKWGSIGSSTNYEFLNPSGVAVETQGNVTYVYVADTYNHRVQKYRIDSQPPSTSISLGGDLGANGWYTSNVKVTLSATDVESGVSKTSYKIDSGAWSQYGSPFNITSEGTTLLFYNSTDLAGNIETTKNQTIQIDKTFPQANFTFSPENPRNGEQIQFNDTSWDSVGAVVSWFWTFGDGENSTLQNPTYTYAENGTFIVTLQVTDEAGHINSSSSPITILWNDIPVALFTESAETVYTGVIITFNATDSYDPDGTIASYFWDFGDGTNTTGVVATHAYLDNGTYIVTLTVTDDIGATGSANSTKTVLNRPPLASFTESTHTAFVGEIIYFNASDSYDPDGSILSYFWDFGDGTNATGVTASHAYANSGEYTVTLTVTDNDGDTAIVVATKTIS